MNITELIGDLKYYGTHVAEGAKATAMLNAADALKAQQVCIEQMREAVKNSTEHWNGHPEYERVASLQPSLSALREHDAEVCQEFANFLGIEKREDVVKWIGAVRKGG
jgi:hypothetical protein